MSLNLPPERDLPGANTMVDDILSDVTPATPVQRQERPRWVAPVAAGIALLAVGAAVASQYLADRGAAIPATPVPTAIGTPSVDPEQTPTPVVTPTPTPTEGPSTTSPTPSSPEPGASTSAADPGRPAGPVTERVDPGATVHLRYFDVTVGEQRFDDLGTATGYFVTVCYVAPHPGANADGTTRTSTDPWRLGVYDGEGQSIDDVRFLPVSDFEPSSDFAPRYEERALTLGECNEGWIAVAHGNPDLIWPSIRYAPADFGDDITWVFYAG